MKKFLSTSVAFIAFASSAFAADLPVKAPPMAAAPVPYLYTWTGIYFGGHIGGAFREDRSFAGGTGSNNDPRFIAGGQIGGDYQFSGNWLIGIEANYSYIFRNDDSVTFAGPFLLNHRTRDLSSVTGRLGYVWGPAVIYAKGGYAHRDFQTDFNNGAGPAPFAFSNNRRNGFTIGGGVEYMFAQAFSAKIEYQYYDFGRTAFAAPAVLAAAGDIRESEHTVKLGINYHLNLSNPLTPRY